MLESDCFRIQPPHGSAGVPDRPQEAQERFSYRASGFNQKRRLQKKARPPPDVHSLPLGEGGGVINEWESAYERLTAEDDEGDVEYKWRLTGISPCRFQHLVTQMQFRVLEGKGQCLYELGVSDDGTPKGLPRKDFEESVDTIRRMAAVLRFDMVLLQECVVGGTVGEPLVCGEVLVCQPHAGAQDVSVAFCGAVDSGKSTLMGVLLSPGLLDNGEGSARQALFNHKHEIDTGRTSSIATRVWPVPCDDRETVGQIVLSPKSSSTAGTFTQQQQQRRKDTRLISLIDMGGEIAKCMLFGLMSRRPDYVCLCVPADGQAEALSLYAQVCCAMGTPFLVVVTRCDTTEEFELDSFLMEVGAVLDGVGCDARTIETHEQALECCRHWLPLHREGAVGEGAGRKTLVPLFCVSCVTGAGLKLVHACIAHLQRPCASPPVTPLSSASRRPFEVLLDTFYDVKDVGVVVRGKVLHNPVEVGCDCYIGPDPHGAFFPIVIRGIHVDGTHVNEAQIGDEATFALSHLPSSLDASHKGKVLVRQPPNVCGGFVASIRVLSQTVSEHSQPIMYTRNARQAVRVVSLEGDGAALVRARCRFMYRPEVVVVGAPVVLHWNPNGIAVGEIKETL